MNEEDCCEQYFSGTCPTCGQEHCCKNSNNIYKKWITKQKARAKFAQIFREWKV